MKKSELKAAILQVAKDEARRIVASAFDINSLSRLDRVYFEKIAMESVVTDMIEEYIDLAKNCERLKHENKRLRSHLKKIKAIGELYSI